MLILKQFGFLVLSALLLYGAWPPYFLGPLVFIGFLPFFKYAENLSEQSRLKKYLFTFLGLYFFLTFFASLASINAWGDVNSSVFIGVFINFLPLSLVVSFYTQIRSKRLSYLFFVFAWASMEIFQLYWDFNAPLFLLSNSLSMFPELIQHYAIWGALGGSMYIISFNIYAFFMLKKIRGKQFQKKQILLSSLILLPTILSIISYQIPEKEGKTVKIGLLMPNFNQYQEKYALDPSLLIQHYNKLYNSQKAEDVDLIMLPETAVLNSGWIENLNRKDVFNPLDSLLPGKEIVLGSYFFSIYQPKGKEIPYYVRFDTLSNVYYQTHNCAIYRSTENVYQIRAKEKFIPFHDAMPYPSILMFTENWVNKVGVRTYVADYTVNKTDIVTTSKGLKLYNLLCFEGYFTDIFVKEKDYDLVSVLANENWNTMDLGKVLFFNYMIPRAIESGKPLLKVSNCGFSGYISSKGKTVAFFEHSSPQLKTVEINLVKSTSMYSKIFTIMNVFVIIITFLLLFSNFVKTR